MTTTTGHTTGDDLTTLPAEAARVAAAFGSGAFFGLSGSGNFHLTHELRDAGLTYYAATHEAACVAMADGHARTAGMTGVATVHQGPGLTNAATALREAARSHTPMVLFAADVPARARHHNQYVNQSALAGSLGVAVESVTCAGAAVDDVVRSFRRAACEQRPVVLMLPIDLHEQRVPRRTLDPRVLQIPEPPAPAADAVEEAAGILRPARHPVILAGRGAVRSGAAQPVAELADKLCAPLLTSTQANGLFRGHPRYLGLAGGFGSSLARHVLAEADVVLVFGCSLNPWTLAGNDMLSSHAQIIQVDTDPTIPTERTVVRLTVVGDCAATSRALHERLQEHSGMRYAAAQITPDPDRGQMPGPGRREDVIDPRVLTRLLDEMLPEERTISIDSGHFMIFPASIMRAPDPQGFLLAQGFMSMGLALAESLGALAARPDRVSVATLGDGGAKMSLFELDTALRHELPVLVVIYNDAAYGAEVHDFASSGRPLDIVRFRDLDFAAIARGLGADGVTVRRPEDLSVVRQWLEHRQRPLVVDAKVDPDIRGDWIE
jgi:thiamine pyrophosphate-dependent acetolactate synthase large subunit-like protein